MKTREHFKSLYEIAKRDGIVSALKYDIKQTGESFHNVLVPYGFTSYNESEFETGDIENNAFEKINNILRDQRNTLGEMDDSLKELVEERVALKELLRAKKVIYSGLIFFQDFESGIFIPMKPNLEFKVDLTL